jgi:hypothetical protein
MHTSGKILAWLAVLLIGVAVWITSKTLAVRDAWMDLAQKNEAEIKKNDEEIARLTAALAVARTNLARTMIGWDRVWPESPARINPNGSLTVQGLAGAEQNQVLFVFAPQQDGTSVYIGDFKVTKPGDNATEAVPYSRRRENDPKPPNFAARVRTLIPNQFQTRLDMLSEQLLEAELTIGTNTEELARQGKLLQQVEKLIELRMAEINGNSQLEGQSLPPVNIRGLLTAIFDEEDVRDAALIEADALLHDLKKTRDAFERIRKDNELRVKSLP